MTSDLNTTLDTLYKTSIEVLIEQLTRLQSHFPEFKEIVAQLNQLKTEPDLFDQYVDEQIQTAFTRITRILLADLANTPLSPLTIPN